MARTRDRVFALVMASAFLISTFGIGIGLAYKAITEGRANSSSSDTQKTQQTNSAKLEGTTMQDFTPIAKVDTLQIIDTKEGTGPAVKPGDTVTVDYTGAVAATGTVFQSSKDFGKPVTFPLDGVIKGWTEGLPGMKVGGTRRLIIPTAMAYGANPPSPSIPANADLVFDIELHKIGK
jgi:FKBP-type peptidyl-prolyl cis-trans isomerase